MTAEREYRILIVDDRREVARVLRTSLELQNRGYLITDVPSGEEALLEIRRVPFDLMVADYRLPGISGPELIERALRRLPELKTIVITGHSVADARKALGNLEIVALFEKPIDMAAFASTVNATLLGEAEAGTLEVSGEAPPSLEFDYDAVARAMDALVADVSPRALAFVNRAGNVLLSAGVLDESLRFSELAVLLANNFTTTAEISTYLGDSTSNAVHYYSGSWHDIFALSVGLHFFLVVIFPGGSQKQMGPVLRFGRTAVERIQAAFGREEAPAPTSMSRRRTGPPPPEVVEVAPEVAGSTPEGAGEDEATAMVFSDLLEEGEQAPELDLDFDALDAELGALSSNPDQFWQEAASDERAAGADSISIDEAIELGLVPKDLEE